MCQVVDLQLGGGVPQPDQPLLHMVTASHPPQLDQHRHHLAHCLDRRALSRTQLDVVEVVGELR